VTMDDFDRPDAEGVEALKYAEFAEYREMIFRKSVFDLAAIDRLIRTGVPAYTVQYQMNHESLSSYGSQIADQQRAAQEVREVWLRRLQTEFPDYHPWVLIETSPMEVLISLRVTRRSDNRRK
jgi:hypothetical protein